jgi:type II secretory pathway pseudopilin PulG
MGAVRVTKSDIMHVTENGKVARSVIASNGERGFSIIEIIVVGVVISIMVAIAVPSSIRQLQAYRLQNSAAVLAGKLDEARMNAIKRNRTVWLRIDKTARTEQIRSNTPLNVVFDIGYPEILSQEINLDAADSVEVAFDSLGRYASGPPTVVLIESNLSKRKNVMISPAGKVTVGMTY